MSRISDKDRILNLLQGAEDGALGRREIIEGLGLSDERYNNVADQLVSDKSASKQRGRAGGLRLGSDVAKAVAEKAAQRPADKPLERDLYPAFERYLESASKGQGSRSVILPTHKTRARKWETPDFVEVRITPFPVIGQWELRLITYELKRRDEWSVESVLQTATYNGFADESLLVVPAEPEVDWAELFGPRIVDESARFGIGLVTFDVHNKILRTHTSAQPQRPSLERKNKRLETIFERLADREKQENVANFIRWATAEVS
jgi:hypothetical protein